MLLRNRLDNPLEKAIRYQLWSNMIPFWFYRLMEGWVVIFFWYYDKLRSRVIHPSMSKSSPIQKMQYFWRKSFEKNQSRKKFQPTAGKYFWTTWKITLYQYFWKSQLGTYTVPEWQNETRNICALISHNTVRSEGKINADGRGRNYEIHNRIGVIRAS